jgi:hypothetical protein
MLLGPNPGTDCDIPFVLIPGDLPLETLAVCGN